MIKNVWNRVKKATGYEDSEAFAQKYMDEMDVRIQDNLKQKKDISEVYSTEMEKLEELQSDIVTPPPSVHKKKHYQDVRIHTLNKVVKKYRDIFRREYGEKFNEAMLFDIKLQTESDEGRAKFLSDIKERGKSEVIGKDIAGRRKFLQGLNDEGRKRIKEAYRSVPDLSQKVDEHLREESKNGLKISDTMDGSIYVDTVEAISGFSIDNLMPGVSVLDSDQMKLMDFEHKFYQLSEFIKKVSAKDQENIEKAKEKEAKDKEAMAKEDSQNEEYYIKLKRELSNLIMSKEELQGRIARSLLLDNKTANPIDRILCLPRGWDFMLRLHPHMLMEYIANDLFQKLDGTCKDILKSSGNISQLNNNEYLKLIEIRKAFSRMMSELILREDTKSDDRLMLEFIKYNSYYDGMNKSVESRYFEMRKKKMELSKSIDELKRKEKEEGLTKDEYKLLDMKEQLFSEAEDELANSEFKIFDGKRYNQVKKSLDDDITKANEKYLKNPYSKYFNLLSGEDKDVVDKLDTLFKTHKKQEAFDALNTNAKLSKVLEPSNKEIKVSDNEFLKDLGKRLFEKLGKGNAPSGNNTILKKISSLSFFCCNNSPEDRLRVMEDIFDDEGKKNLFGEIEKSEVKTFMRLICSGTSACETIDKTGLGYICRTYPALLAKITLEFLLDELERSDFASDFSDLLSMKHDEICLTRSNKVASAKSLEQVKTQYDYMLTMFAKSDVDKAHFFNYTQWKNVDIIENSVKGGGVGKDLIDLGSNDTDTLTQLCEKYPNDDLLKINIDYRKECIKKINDIAEYPAQKKKGQTEGKIENKGGLFSTDYHLKNFKHHYGNKSNDNWVVALTDMICFKGTGKGSEADKALQKNLDYDVIKAYRPIPDYRGDDRDYKNLDEVNMDMPSEISHHMNLISKILPNAALHKISVQTDKAIKNENEFTKWLRSRIEETVLNQQAPLCYFFEDECWMITGMKDGKVLYYTTLAEEQRSIPFDELKRDLIGLISQNCPVDFYWLTDVAPEFEESCKKPNGVLRYKKRSKSAPAKLELQTMPIADGYKHENYNAFKVLGSIVGNLDGKEEYIYLPKKNSLFD